MTSPVSMQWDPADFRQRIQAVLDAFLDEQAERLAPLGGDAARLVAEARTFHGGRDLSDDLALLVLRVRQPSEGFRTSEAADGASGGR